MNITDTRAITSVTVSRTCSLRDQMRTTSKDNQPTSDSGTFSLNKRSISNDKMTSDSMTPVFMPQRGSSLRHNGKSSLQMSSPNSSTHHPFKMIQPIDTSPRISECNIDTDVNSSIVKASSKKPIKFKHRGQVQSSGGPLIPDHSLIKEPSRENIHFTPRPPLVKKFSSDQDEATSDTDASQIAKSSRYTTAPRPPISPTRGIVIKCPSSTTSAISSGGKTEKPLDLSDEDTSELEDNRHSDCETPSPSNNPTDAVVGRTHRSSLRKGSDSPNQSDGPGRMSPSPTKTVKFHTNTEVKIIPRSQSMNGMSRSSKRRSTKSGTDRNTKLQSSDQKLVESHQSYIHHCTDLIRHQVSLLENLRNDRISVLHYKRDLADFLEHQKKVVANLQSLLSETTGDKDKTIGSTS